MSKANEIQHGGQHYKKLKVQHWDFVVKANLRYLEGCGTKYLSRHRDKNGLEDLQKAEHYIQKILELHLLHGYTNTFNGDADLLTDFIEGAQMDQLTQEVFTGLVCWSDEESLVNLLELFPVLKKTYA